MRDLRKGVLWSLTLAVGFSTLGIDVSGEGITPVQEAAADYSDSRDYSSSKAKSQIRAIRKEFAKLDEAIADPRKLKNPSFFSQRAKAIERNLERAAERDPTWDLAKERAYYADIRNRWNLEKAKVERQEMEAKEPDVGDWDIPAFAGAAKMKVEEPTWCAGVEVSERDNWISDYSALATNLDDDSLARAAQHACRAPKFSKRQQWTRVWRQALANRTGASAKLTEDFYKLWIRSGGRYGDSALRDQTCSAYGYSPHNRGGSSDDKRSRSARSSKSRSRVRARGTGGPTGAGQRAEIPSQVAFKKATAIALGCEDNPVRLDRGNVYVDKLAWWIDQGTDVPSELVRAVYILDSIGLSIGEEDLARGDGWKADALKTLGSYALVAADVNRLDQAKFEKELLAMQLNEWGQVMARITFSRAQHMGRIYKKAYAGMDPKIRVLAFEVPAKAFDDWAQSSAANRAGLQVASKVEESFLQNRTQDIKNCHDKAHKALTSYLKGAGKKVKSKEGPPGDV